MRNICGIEKKVVHNKNKYNNFRNKKVLLIINLVMMIFFRYKIYNTMIKISKIQKKI